MDQFQAAVHHVYMKGKEELRWRVTCMRLWRVYRDYTQEQAAEALSDPPFNMPTTHASIGRYENGKQMPKGEMLEAIARLYRTDVHSLLNERPPIAKTG